MKIHKLAKQVCMHREISQNSMTTFMPIPFESLMNYGSNEVVEESASFRKPWVEAALQFSMTFSSVLRMATTNLSLVLQAMLLLRPCAVS
jgi:hypothetical protein